MNMLSTPAKEIPSVSPVSATSAPIIKGVQGNSTPGNKQENGSFSQTLKDAVQNQEPNVAVEKNDLGMFMLASMQAAAVMIPANIAGITGDATVKTEAAGLPVMTGMPVINAVDAGKTATVFAENLLKPNQAILGEALVPSLLSNKPDFVKDVKGTEPSNQQPEISARSQTTMLEALSQTLPTSKTNSDGLVEPQTAVTLPDVKSSNSSMPAGSVQPAVMQTVTEVQVKREVVGMVGTNVQKPAPDDSKTNSTLLNGKSSQMSVGKDVVSAPTEEEGKRVDDASFRQALTEKMQDTEQLKSWQPTIVQSTEKNIASTETKGNNSVENIPSVAVHSPVATTSVVNTHAEKIATAVPVRDSHEVVKQIVEQARLINTQQNTEMVIHLKPEHLGEMALKVSVEQSGAVNASFHSNNPEVRAILEASLLQLKQELSTQGLKVENVGVYAGLGQFLSDQGQRESQQSRSFVKQPSKREEELFAETAEAIQAVTSSSSEDGVDYRV